MLSAWHKKLRPLRAVEGRGFFRIANALVELGASYGKQDVGKLVRHRTTLKREYLPKIVAQKQNDIIALIRAAPQFPKFALTSDMWSDKYKQRSFLSLSAYYINKDWEFVTHMLGVDEFLTNEKDTKKSTANVRKQCENILLKFFNPEETKMVMQESWIVTDGGSNMIHVMENRKACQCHRLNTMIGWTLIKTPLLSPEQISLIENKGRDVPQKKLFSLQQQCPKILVFVYL